MKDNDNNTVYPYFSLDAEGYTKAQKWLKEIGEWDYVSTHGFSTDGYSIIEEANAIWENKMKHDKD